MIEIKIICCGACAGMEQASTFRSTISQKLSPPMEKLTEIKKKMISIRNHGRFTDEVPSRETDAFENQWHFVLRLPQWACLRGSRSSITVTCPLGRFSSYRERTGFYVPTGTNDFWLQAI